MRVTSNYSDKLVQVADSTTLILEYITDDER